MRKKRHKLLALVGAGALGLGLISCERAGAELVDCARETVVLEDGLEVRDLECGSGAIAESGSSLTVRYSTTLEGGEAVDDPAGEGVHTFRLGSGQVVAGWDQGLQGMAVGGVRSLVVPPELAYADAGLYPDVPPGETITYEVELIEAKDPESDG